MRLFTFVLLSTAVAVQAQAPATPQQPGTGQSNPPPGAAGKEPPGAAGQTPGAARPGTQPQDMTAGAPLSIDLAGALQRARDYNQQYVYAGIAAQVARENRLQARAAQLPTLNLFNQYIYTQGNGTPSGVFVANDGVHIYNEQATVHAELFSLARRAEYRRALAAEAAARAQQDIAARGLVATVVQNYYALITAQHHAANARRSVDEARQFTDITTKLERGGEAAHADVIKAQLQLQQRQRELMDADAGVERASLALGVILFSDLGQKFNVLDDLRQDQPLPPFDEIESLALSASPEIRAAQAGLREAEAGISAARAAYIPSLVVDYFYGIDANVLGFRGPEGRQNLGSVAQGTVTIPVWNWGTTRSKIRQAELQRQQAQFDVRFAQRSIQTNLRSYYLEAQTARAQLASLQDSLTLSEESLRLTVLRYQAGEATALEVVDAQSTLAAARNAYDDGLARYRVALAALQTLTGRL